MPTRSSVFAVVLLVSSVSAQTMSPCVQDCIEQSLPGTPCSGVNDVSCFCTDAKFQNALAGCLSANCPDELSGAQSAQAQQCSDIGVNPSNPPPVTGSAPGSAQQPQTQAPSTGSEQTQPPAQNPTSSAQPPPNPSNTATGTQTQPSNSATGLPRQTNGASTFPRPTSATEEQATPTGPVTSPTGGASQMFVGGNAVWAAAVSILGGIVGASLLL